MDIAQHPVAHAYTQGAMTASRDLRSLPVAMILLLLYYILYYYYSKKKTREKLGHEQNILPVTSGQGLSGNVTSCDVASGSSTPLNVVCDVPIYYCAPFFVIYKAVPAPY